MKTIFMGTPNFAAPILEAMIKSSDFKPLAVVTSPDKPVGRKQEITSPPIKILAQKSKITILQPEKIRNKEFTEQIKKLDSDLIVVAAYGKIIPADILAIPKYGCVNVHASLLPKYRGPAPIQAAILEGEKETGVTIMLMDEKMDTGPILSQEQVEIDAKETSETLHDKLSSVGANLLLKTLPKYIEGELKPQAQDETLATYCQMITRDHGKLVWDKTSEELECQIRGLAPWPGTFTFYHIQPNKRLKIISADILDAQVLEENPEYGKMVFDGNKVIVKTGNGRLSIAKLQIEGSVPMSAKEFINGYKNLNRVVLK